MLELGIQMLLVLVFIAYYTAVGVVKSNWNAWVLLPVLLVHLGMMGMGVGIIVSSMTTKYRDLSILVSFAIQLWMYITPVVYPLSQAKEGWIRKVLMLNPVTAPVEFFRYIVLGTGEIMYGTLIWSWCFTAVVTILGIMIFNRVEKTFMDTV